MKKSNIILSFFFSSILNLFINKIIIQNDKIICESISNFYLNESIHSTSLYFLIINYLLILTIIIIILCYIKKKYLTKIALFYIFMITSFLYFSLDITSLDSPKLIFLLDLAYITILSFLMFCITNFTLLMILFDFTAHKNKS